MKKMKKLLAVLSAAVMAVGMAATVFAAPSPSVSGIVTGIAKAVDKNGADARIIVESVDVLTGAEKTAAEEIKDIAKVKEVMGSAFAEGMQVVDVKNVRAEGDVAYPVTITFKVTGITSASKVAILHYDAEKAAWEVLEAKAGEGTMEATFNSLSPVAFVVDKDTAASVTTSTTTSPKTGEVNVLGWAGAVAVLGLVGMAVTYKKREQA